MLSATICVVIYLNVTKNRLRMLQYSLFYSQESKKRNGWRDDGRRRKGSGKWGKLEKFCFG